MSDIDSPLAAPFDVSHLVTLRLLDAVPDEGLAARYSPRTRCVAAQFAHIHNVRMSQLEVRGGSKKGAIAGFGRGAEPSRTELVDALSASAVAVRALLVASEANGKVKGWSAPASTFVGYLVAHEAHHRGLAIVSLRMAGIKLPQDVVYGIWDHSALTPNPDIHEGVEERYHASWTAGSTRMSLSSDSCVHDEQERLP